jgi:HSP20 family protein
MKYNRLFNPRLLAGLTLAAPLMASHLDAQPLWAPDFFFDDGIQNRQAIPAVNLSEKEKEYVVRADLPGMKKEDIRVTFENGMLTIAGERKLPAEEKDSKSRFSESFYGSFSRSFSMPVDADPTKVSAEFRDGVLWIKIGKNAAAKGHTIEIK